MKINKNSWHYKLNKFMDDNFIYNLPKSLCSYFWGTIFRIVKSLVILGFISFCLVGIGVSVLEIWYGEENLNIFIYFLAGILSICLLFLPFYIWELLDNYWQKKKPTINIKFPKFKKEKTIPKAKKPDGLFKSFYKAHKEKVCPLIEYED